MPRMRDHDVNDYAALREMDATDVGVLTAADQACLDELGQYMVSTEAWKRFAIWLLHKHFEPHDGEVFVERSIPWPPQTHTTPIPRAAFSASGLHATVLRFDTDVASGVGLIGMEFAEPADFGSADPISPADEAVLAELAQRLRSHGKIDRFGVRLIRNQLGLSEDQLLQETCDTAHRALHCEVTERGQVRSHKTIETTWQWKPVITKTGTAVTMQPQQECLVECVADEEIGHDVRHTGVEPQFVVRPRASRHRSGRWPRPTA